MSTILGTIIFIGILFSSVIPMMLVMKQADVILEQEKLEIVRRDDEGDRESLELYPIPDLAATHVNVTILNTCETSIDIVRVWINDTLTDVTVTVNALSHEQIGPFPIQVVDGSSFDVRVTTGRGNVYTAETGILHYQGGEWVTETLGIRLILPSRPGKGARTNLWLNELKVTIIDEDDDVLYSNYSMYWAISASENFFELESAGAYNVTIYIWCKAGGEYPGQHWEKIYDDVHSIMWPMGEAIVEIKFVIDGDYLVV
ncbi:MAG: hypothetical protein H8E40_00625 [Chloroflexi bacterium]|nr:hypothetical protein [Chloroflexota bacterium]MBL7168253.1 hypothetical protein [Candidatus Bathyarchaeota archaeon]